MPDTKITALTALTAADPANDVLPIVDVSDTTMAASGTTKKISINNVLGCSGTATLASATITGNLTVDTNTFFVDSANNRVGIGTVTPAAALAINLPEVSSTAGTSAIIYNNTGGGNRIAALRLQNLTNQWNIRAYGSVTDDLRFGSGAAGSEVDYLSIGNTGIFTWSNVGGVAGTAMTLNATGLGVGGSPITSHLITSQGPIAISGTGGGTRTSYIANANACSIYYTDGGGSGFFADFGNLIIQPRTSAARSVVIATGSTTPVERAVVKSTGQVRFVPLASDPAGAEAGDVYYNSTSNKLKCYNGTTWNDLF